MAANRLSRREVVSSAGAAIASLGLQSHARAHGETDGQPVHSIDVFPARTGVGAVSIVRPSHFPSFAASIRSVVAQAGGLGFIRENERVLIKPATNSSNRSPATTDPELALIVAQLVREAGGIPFFADRTMFLRSTARTFHALGYNEAARQARISCQSLDHSPARRVSHDLALHWGGQQISIYEPVLKADHLINLCTPRTHKLGDFTMAIKNLVGVVQGRSRIAMHLGSGFHERLAEISLVVPTALSIMDGREGFTDGGPDEGDVAKLNFVAASRDVLAIDAVGLGFLRIAGANSKIVNGSIWDLPMIKRAAELKLGAGSADHLLISGLADDELAALRAQLA